MANIENGMKQQEEAGKWRMLSREVCEEYDENDANGVLHILQVNWAYSSVGYDRTNSLCPIKRLSRHVTLC